jgi:heterodisulfide reductase subunit A-like polyferredoxin
MKVRSSELTRREFLIAGSAAIAAPVVLDLSSSEPTAQAATAKTKAATGIQKIYYIGHDCVGCQVCRMMCPAGAIDYGNSRNEIDQEKCQHCGTCYRECPISVITEM